MIVVVHQNGKSFRGLMSYLMTGKDGEHPERVSFTHTHNLATDDACQAWKVMAATARMQDELKDRAGIAKAGRKSADVVTHITLSWDKSETVDKEEMVAAALGSLSYYGVVEGEKLNKKQTAKRTQYADQHQAVIVGHSDQNHDHCHIALNRVHGGHGVLLPENKNFEKLSAWALDYRRSMGREDLCPRRAVNAAKRGQGYLTSHPRQPRNVYERDREIDAADPGSRKRAHLENQKRRAKELTARTRKLERQRHTESRELDRRFEAQRRELRSEAGGNIRTAKARVKDVYAGKIQSLHERQQDEKAAFQEAKATWAGRVNNAWSALKTKAWMTEIRRNPLRATTQAFALACSSGLQQRQLDRQHVSEQRALAGERMARERLVAARERAALDQKTAGLRDRYTVERASLELRHAMEAAKLKAEWKQLDRDRRSAVQEDDRAPDEPEAQQLGGGSQHRRAVNEQPEETVDVREQFARAANPDHQADPGDDGEDEKQRRIDKLREQMRESRQQNRGLRR